MHGSYSTMSHRPDWDTYFLQIAHLVSSRSTCVRRAVGAVITRDNRILATGYNGSPQNIPHCEEEGCLRKQLGTPSGERHEICRGLHAEQNAIVQAAVYGASVKEATIYVTCQPCVVCAKMIINAGIREVIFEGVYPDSLAMDLLEKGKVIMTRKKIVKEGKSE